MVEDIKNLLHNMVQELAQILTIKSQYLNFIFNINAIKVKSNLHLVFSLHTNLVLILLLTEIL